MYWTLDTRPPTLDELVVMAKQRHAQRVEEIAAEEPVPQISTPIRHQSNELAQHMRDANVYMSHFQRWLSIEIEKLAYEQMTTGAAANSFSDSLRHGTGASMVGLGGVQHVPYKTLFDMECA